jgi:hypothetical protein
MIVLAWFKYNIGNISYDILLLNREIKLGGIEHIS